MLKKILIGIIASGIAGLINGAIIAYLGFWEEISTKFEAATTNMAFGMHMFFSLITGVLFAVLLSKYLKTLAKSIGYGFLFSIVVYCIALLIISIRFGESQFNFSETNFIARVLLGHGIFGVLMGLGYYLLLKYTTNKMIV